MRHFFDQIAPGYRADLAIMKVRPECRALVDSVAKRLCRNVQEGRYAEASKATAVPEIWIAASFEREAASDFARSPGQGDPIDEVSRHVPKGRGPFRTWAAAAIDAYHIDGLDKVGAQNWSWALGCYYGELFNGFGYRDYHRMRSPYLWGGTNLQSRGKYTSDGGFDSGVMDPQIGMVPLMYRMATLMPALTFPGAWPFPELSAPLVMPVGAPAQTPAASFDVKAVQRALNAKGFGPLMVDGSFGRQTSAALRHFESEAGLTPDGLMDKETVDRLLAI